ncbi:MAG TPA: MFS transporter [Solirubrobacteraceae bacterium]|nr:MFS transporter [Solirubrobacteraceae bacterium]
MGSKYRAVLSVPGAGPLFATALVGRFPQGMSSLAILLLVRGTTHSYAAAGAAVGAFALATAASAPIIGRLVDRFGRARVLMPFACAQAVVYALIVVAAVSGAGAAALIVLSAATGALLPPIAPSVRSLLREVFDDHAVLDTAYALESIFQETIWIVGPLLVALVIAVTSPEAAVAMLGVVCVGGTSLFLRSPLVRNSGSGRGTGHERSPALASPELRALLAPIFLTGASLGAVEVGLPSLALHAGSRPASGLLLALWAVGSMCGGLWYGAHVWRSPLSTRYQLLLVLLVVCTAPLIAARSIPAGVVCSLLAGLAVAPVFSCQYALVGRSVTSGSETEAFTWVSAALIGGLAAGSAIGGAVIGPSGVGAPFALACLASLLAVVIAVGLRDRVRQPAQNSRATADARGPSR